MSRDGDEPTLEEESELHRLAYEAGDNAALLLMIRHCFMLHWPVPDWAANAFVDACSYVEMGGARSWDEVFGKPHPGKHKRSVALKNLKYGIHRRVCNLHKGGMPIDEALFDRVGQEMKPPVSKTVISDSYYRVERILRRLGLPVEQDDAPGLPIRTSGK
jgi:hypothetical protein